MLAICSHTKYNSIQMHKFILLCMSACGESGHTGRLYTYDPANHTWTNLTNAVTGAPPLARKDARPAALGGRLWLLGGWVDEQQVPPLRVLTRYRQC